MAINKREVKNSLEKAMKDLYEARLIATGPLVHGDKDDKDDFDYPEMDHETFNEICSIQTKLQALISKLGADTFELSS